MTMQNAIGERLAMTIDDDGSRSTIYKREEIGERESMRENIGERGEKNKLKREEREKRIKKY